MAIAREAQRLPQVVLNNFMRVLYDGHIYLMQAAGGVNRYFANLIGRLPADVTPYLTMCGSRSVNFPVNPRMKVYNYRRFRPAADRVPDDRDEMTWFISNHHALHQTPR